MLGLPTLNSILLQLGLANGLQKNRHQLNQEIGLGTIRKIYQKLFSSQLREQLSTLCQKDPSTWSRTPVTAVIDDSVFRQWLGANLEREDPAYGRFFSGQYHRVVYGYDVLLMGFHIGGVFYPFALEFIGKQANKKSEKRAEVAQRLIKRWQNWLAEQDFVLPKLCLSVDSGFNDMALSQAAERVGFQFLSVPKKSHLFLYKNQKMKLSDIIEQYYLPAEKAYQEKKPESPSFQLRIRAQYICKKKKVSLLIFRLNNSQKMTVVYALNKDIFAKTMRRHWFARTYIEQFFKLLKHVLKIQESRSRNKESFERNLYLLIFVGLQAQKLLMYLRKQFDYLNNKGVIYLQRTLVRERDLIDLLQDVSRKKPLRTT